MLQLIGTRSTGKTRKLLENARNAEGIVICKDPDKMRTKAYDYGIVGVEYLSYYEFLNNGYNFKKRIFIDELEEFISYFNDKIDGYTLSIND